MDPKILDALTPLVASFDKLGIAYQIGGSLASSVHGVPRSSLDVDLLISMGPEKVGALVESLEQDYYVSSTAVAAAVMKGTSFNVIHLGTMLKVDLFITGTDPFRRQSLDRRRAETLGDDTRAARLNVTSAEDILLHKLEWFRRSAEASERQWLDVLGVLKVQAESLDLAYLEKWAAVLQVADLLKRALHETGLWTE